MRRYPWATKPIKDLLAVRTTTLLRKLMNLKQTCVRDFEFNAEGLIVDVSPTTQRARCSGCDIKCKRIHDRYKGRTWRHLDMAGTMVHLRYDVRRVICPRCGVRVEGVPWATTGSNFTYEFENQLGYLAQRLDQTTVSELMRIAWRTVGDIARRVVTRHGSDSLMVGLTHIGVDELSYRKNHQYITIVTDHLRGRVVWVGKGKNSETLGAFFDELGAEGCAALQVVTLDMSAAYIKAVTERAKNAQLIFDRFHVQRLVHDALDEVRRAQMRGAEDKRERRALKGTRWPLLKNPWNLKQSEEDKLNKLQSSNRPLYRAYLLKETLLSILDSRWLLPKLKLEQWLEWAARSRLPSFVTLGRTIRKYKDGILAYVYSGMSNARSEGINSKIRTITRRAYGFHSPSSLIAFIFLCCSGIELHPVFKYPVMAH